MTKRIQRWFVPVAAVAAVVVGGGAIASAAQQPAQTPAPITKSAPSSEPVGGPDTDAIQSGDQTTPDTLAASATTSSSAEAPGTERSAASEQPGAPEQPGSETAANDDGPGGHADEPGNPSADHQFQGVE